MLDFQKIEEENQKILKKISTLKNDKDKLFCYLNYFKKLTKIDNQLIHEAFLAESIGYILPQIETYSPYGAEPILSEEILAMLKQLANYANSDHEREIIESSILRINEELEKLLKLLNGDSTESHFDSKVYFPLIGREIENKLFVGAVDYLTISLKELKDSDPDKFLVVPSLPKLDQKFRDQLNNSWEIAKAFIEEKHNIKVPDLQVIIKFDKKHGIYEGDSLGVALTLSLIAEISNYLNLRIKYKINQSALFTGLVNSEGNLDSLSCNIIKKKSATAFYSTIHSFIIPKSDYDCAVDIIETENQKFKKRSLNLIPADNIREIINNKDIFKEVIEPLPAYYFNKLKESKYLPLMLALIIVLSISPIFIFDNDRIDFLEYATENYGLDVDKLAPVINDDALISLSLDETDLTKSANSKIDTFNNIQLVENRFGEEGKAIYLNGDKSFIHLKNPEKMKCELPISISIWMKKEGDNRGWVFASNFDSTAYTGVWFGFIYGYTFSINFGNGGPIAASTSRRSLYTIQPVTGEEWKHFVGIIKDPDNMDIYLNNQKMKTYYRGQSTELIYSDDGIPSFGEFNSSNVIPIDYFKGSIDDFRFYNKILSEDEIDKLFHEKY